MEWSNGMEMGRCCVGGWREKDLGRGGVRSSSVNAGCCFGGSLKC